MLPPNESLMARHSLNPAPPGVSLSWVSLEFQIQRELDAPWNVALARHVSKASSTPVRIGGAVEMPIKSIPKYRHKTEIDVLNDFGVFIEVEVRTVFGEPSVRRICP